MTEDTQTVEQYDTPEPAREPDQTFSYLLEHSEPADETAYRDQLTAWDDLYQEGEIAAVTIKRTRFVDDGMQYDVEVDVQWDELDDDMTTATLTLSGFIPDVDRLPEDDPRHDELYENVEINNMEDWARV